MDDDIFNTTENNTEDGAARPEGFYSYKRPETANDPQYSATATNKKNNDYSSGQGFNEYASSSDAGYAPYTAEPVAKKPKKKKKKRGVPVIALIAGCLACAILGGGASAAMIMAFYGDSSSGTTNTIINVDKSAAGAVSAVAEKVIPSVVGIRTTAQVTSFFGFPQSSSSEGSGVIYTTDGYIITNYHVIADAVDSSKSSLEVFLPSDTDTAIKAQVVGYNDDCDLAVIKISKKNLPAAEFANSDELQVGEAAIAIGNPGGLDFFSSVSSGIVSGLNRTIEIESTTQMKLIQTDAAINPGNSGGALCDAKGKVIGINSSKISSENFEGMGFAIPSNFVRQICDDIISNKDNKKAYLGIIISTDYSPEYLQAYGYPAGAVVESVTDGSPAAKVGIMQYDIITAINGVEIKDYDDYNKQRLAHKPGETVTLTVYRSGKYYDVKLTLGESLN